MNPFIYNIPTRVYFGPEEMEHLGEELSRYGKRVLFVYDGDYIKSNGIYDLVMKAGRDYDLDITEFTNVRPNPRHTDCEEAIAICKEKNIEVVLGVGGGSVIDSSKAIAAGAVSDAPLWDLVIKKAPTEKALPVIAMSTISATGSEMDSGAVITNESTFDKKVYSNPNLLPKATFLNPEYTFTVPKYQTACGAVDIIAHVFEVYFSPSDDLYMLDTVAQGLVRTVLKYGPIAYNDPTNYEARANLMWASPWAINHFIEYDKRHLWSMHPMEHELSAYYDITHGLGLAILMPRWLRFVKDEKSYPKFRGLGLYAFDLDRSLSDEEMADKVIEKIEEFSYKTLGLTSNLTDLGIDDSKFEEMADKLTNNGTSFHAGFRPLYKEDIIEIYRNCL
ncbi:MAG: iron-containing alcohol dehydrogenase [Erysipelotrichaceae bacterium]|nr:iron-containing alcohol dehydrogenase [Erysipelotrichaceae bacterium]